MLHRASTIASSWRPDFQEVDDGNLVLTHISIHRETNRTAHHPISSAESAHGCSHCPVMSHLQAVYDGNLVLIGHVRVDRNDARESIDAHVLEVVALTLQVQGKRAKKNNKKTTTISTRRMEQPLLSNRWQKFKPSNNTRKCVHSITPTFARLCCKPNGLFYTPRLARASNQSSLGNISQTSLKEDSPPSVLP